VLALALARKVVLPRLPFVAVNEDLARGHAVQLAEPCRVKYLVRPQIPLPVPRLRGLHGAGVAFFRKAQCRLGALALGEVAPDAAIPEELSAVVEAGLAAELVEALFVVLDPGNTEADEALARRD